MKRVRVKPKRGDKRVRRKFLFIPRWFGIMWVWLEWAHIEETYMETVDLCDGLPIMKWVETNFG